MKIAPYVEDVEIEPGQVLVFAVVAPADGSTNKAVATSTVITYPDSEVYSGMDDKEKVWRAILHVGENAKEKGYVP